MRAILILLACVVLSACATTRAPALQDAPLALWYAAPASDWEREGLPIGNGAMGMVIMGGVAEDHLQFNEKTLWTGGPGSAEGYNFGWPAGSSADEVAAVQRDLARDGTISAEEAARRLGRDMLGYGHYQSFGSLVLSAPDLAGAVSDYRRELDISRGVARVSFVHEGVRYTRDYFASYPDGVIVVRLTADAPGRLNFTAELNIPDNRTSIVRAQGSRITAWGELNDNGLRWEAQAMVIPSGGQSTQYGERIKVEGADAVTILLRAGTNYTPSYPTYRGGDPHAGVHAGIEVAAQQGYATLWANHQRDYRALFDRVSLDLNAPALAGPTDVARAAYGADPEQDRALEELYFQYGRYLLIASSRAGSLPANLQGVWNNSATPPWNADYHVNINLQMNYWLAETTNLAETTPPLFDFIDSLIPPGENSARRIVGAEGWTLFLNTNIFGFTGVISWPTAFWQPEAGAWLAQHYYEHFLFSRDEAFLRARAYPAMKGAARFWLDALVEDGQGRLVVSPSFSPEHGSFTVGAAMSQQIVFDLFTNVSEAAEIVGDAAFAAEIDAALARLDPGLRIGSWGQLQEWREDLDDASNDHRHVSHLFALHPGRQISPLTTPEFAEAARVSLRARGDGGTGWSKAWKINFWARLHDGDHAHLMLAQQLRESTLPNLWDTHPPFQIDGNFGASAGVAEMLLQSHAGVVHILPALPSAWPDGAVRGLRARGGLVVDIDWTAGRAREVVIHAETDGEVTVRIRELGESVAVTELASGRVLRAERTEETVTFHAIEGLAYRISGLEAR